MSSPIGSWASMAVGLVMTLAACAQGEPVAPTSTATTMVPPASTTVEPSTTGTSFHVEPIDDDWTLDDLDWSVTPSCCDLPARGPVSPGGPIPAEGWPADGFYHVITTRPGDPPGVLHLAIRPWVSCSDLPENCPPDPPPDGVVADPAGEMEKVVFMDELTVIIRPLEPGVGLTGSGTALRELLTGFCRGGLPSPFPINCGVDHAVTDWIWAPSQSGTPVGEIVAEILSRQDEPSFPFVQYDDGSSEIPCSAARACPLAYRGPHGTHFAIHPGMVAESEGWPGQGLYGWWTSLEIRGGLPFLYIDTAQIAG